MGPKKIKLACEKSLSSNSIDWNKCCLCQLDNTLPLLNPVNNNNESCRNTGYVTVAKNLIEFNSLGGLPETVNLASLDEGGGIETTFVHRQAKWHKSCYFKFSTTKLERLRASIMKPDDSLSTNSSESAESYSNRFTRSSNITPSVDLKSQICFLCNKEASWKAPLFNVSTVELDLKVRECAKYLNNSELIAILSAGDLIAQEAKYHLKCLSSLFNSCRSPEIPGNSMESSDPSEDNISMCEGMAFADLAFYIQEKLSDKDTDFIFRMVTLVSMYRERLAYLLGVDVKTLPNTHSTRLRERILLHFPNLRADKKGKEYLLVRSGANVVQDVCREDADGDSIAFQRFSAALRRQIEESSVVFKGEFGKSCQEASVPPALLAAVNMILYGTSFNLDNRAPQAALSISQLIILNHHKKAPKNSNVRNKKIREPPLPLYIALSTYGRTRHKSSIDEMHSLGLTVSSNRVVEVTSSMCHLVIERAKEEGILCPSNLQRGLFTVGAYDNIDHNLTSSTSQDSFHGTSISIFQIPISGDVGEPRTFRTNLSDICPGKRDVPDLPDNFSIVKTVVLPSKQPHVPKSCRATELDLLSVNEFSTSWLSEREWLNHVYDYNPESTSLSDLSWAAFHGSRQNEDFREAINSLLPLFHEHSTSVSMVRHGLDLIRKITHLLNPNQIPVMCVDQPLFTLAKLVQWNWPDLYGESTFIMLFAPFHIEQAFLRVLGQFLQGSGWVAIVSNSDIATEAAADATLKVTHVTKARAIHQVTAAVLYSLLKEAHKSDSSEVSLDEWIAQQESSSPTFKFWFIVLNLEILLLRFVRSIREGRYLEFKNSMKSMLPWFFSFDHQNYARWLTVHVRDLEELPVKAPSVYEHFLKGGFVVHKTPRPFSALGIDQAHEQNNAIVKGDGGAVGLLQDPKALHRWSIAGPEISKLLSQFAIDDEIGNEDTSLGHHEQYPALQKKFRQKVDALRDAFVAFGNPFQETSADLVAIDSRILAENDGVVALKNIEQNGLILYQTFIKERLGEEATKSVFDPISKIRTKIFGVPKQSQSVKNKELKGLKNDVQLFSRLFIVSRNRELDLDAFFQFENQVFPPSISTHGDLRSCQKSELVPIMEDLVHDSQFSYSCDGIVYDGAALIHGLPPHTSQTFEEYCNNEFRRRISGDVIHLQAKRIDLVWDMYDQQSLKMKTREKRGTGTRHQVLPRSRLPGKWNNFLQNSENKQELFSLLGRHAVSRFDFVDVCTNMGSVITSTNSCITLLAGHSCHSQQEEADGRIICHVMDMAKAGAKTVVIHTVDTDVLVLAISFFSKLSMIGLTELWVSFGVGKKHKYLAAHRMAEELGAEKSEALRGFHSFTGCDTVSSFSHKGKKTAWKV